MDVLILAGVLGNRLKSVVGELPKVRAPIPGRPFLAYLLEQLKEQAFGTFVLSWDTNPRLSRNILKMGRILVCT